MVNIAYLNSREALDDMPSLISLSASLDPRVPASLTPRVASIKINILPIQPPAIRGKGRVAFSSLFENVDLIPIVLRFYDSHTRVLRHQPDWIIVRVRLRPKIDVGISAAGFRSKRIRYRWKNSPAAQKSGSSIESARKYYQKNSECRHAAKPPPIAECGLRIADLVRQSFDVRV